ncbi:MAG: tRNA (adenosine(37)-N6)-threonylcarbamoyltransferase complex ATPase subunit type 1 TsaE [Patescibacteria group bacterium]|nr:tRNA (adenosine(37)-N6)-threonylcarbamoyltransferase complex ATPase subunit type 1 TsaE [Patescibacteria group bacterium]MDD4611235.1 tRNA (adenosine(37)-N6)-threonylcarbamoyltransferase complex ATPase subunit type 1 TsaE [Patescibacteria group bacterium]
MNKIITNSSKETLAFAKNFAKKLKGGEVIGLVGDLGAGKTFFTQGVAKELGIKTKVNSPTFVIMKIYNSTSSADGLKAKSSKLKALVHIDAYRLKSGHDLEAIGALDYFGRPDTVVIIEWADKIKKILPKKTKYINIKNLEEHKRVLIIK